MSIIIQKKRVSQKAAHFLAQEVATQDTQTQQHLRIFNCFDFEFHKALTQKSIKELKHTLDTFYKVLKNDKTLIFDLSKLHEACTSLKDVCSFQKASGVVNTLADFFVNRKIALLKNKKSLEFFEQSEGKEINILVLKILKVFAMINPTYAKMLSHWPKFTEMLLNLVLSDHKTHFKQVLGMLEALISAEPATISPSVYPIVYKILVSMPMKNFARFSRIIALFVLENSEKTDFKDLPSCYSENKMIAIHSFLLSVPKLLDNYITILGYLYKIVQTLIQITPDNIHETLSALTDSKIIKNSGLNLSFLKPLFEQSEISENLMAELFSPKFIVKFVVKKSNITEIFFILSNLLSSKRKVDIQNQLTQLHFLEKVIDPLFDLFFHPDLKPENSDDPSSNEFFSSNHLTTTRIQLLRIIINFCDRDFSNVGHKDLLISNEEKQLLLNQVIRPTYSLHSRNKLEADLLDEDALVAAFNSTCFESLEKSQVFFTPEVLTGNLFQNVQKKGLLNKIIILLKKVNGNSNYHFWLSSCVESLLRGFHSLHQLFVSHSGLLYGLLDQIMKSEITKANNIQITYDLIGEIIKFHHHNILFLENLCERYDWTKGLALRIEQKIVDSNVFLRSVLLSAEKFRVNEQKGNDQEVKDKWRSFNKSLVFLNTLTKESNEWPNLLVEAVDPDAINHDNICCINTALIIAIFADYRGQLPNFLNQLLSKNLPPNQLNTNLMENFHKVLNVWHRYYQSRSKDGFSLQFTTSIKFEYFLRIQQKIQYFLEENIQKLKQ